MRAFIFVCANEFPVSLLCKQNTIVLKRHSPRVARTCTSCRASVRMCVKVPFTQSPGTTSAPLFTAPLTGAGLPGPSIREAQSRSRFPDDVIPAGAKALFGGVFFHALLLFPFLDPGTAPSHVCFPNTVTQTACLADGAGTWPLNCGGGHSALLKHSRDRQSPPLGGENQRYTNKDAFHLE